MPRCALPLLLALLAGGCGPTPPVETWIEPVHDMLALRSDDRPLLPPACAVGDEIRPALGCLFPARLGRDLDVAVTDAPIRRRFPVPRGIQASGAIVEPSFRTGSRDGWQPLPPVVLHDIGTTVEVDFRLPGALEEGPVDLAARMSALPPRVRTTETRPIAIGPSAVLTVGLGIAPVAREIPSVPVEFLLQAHGWGDERELLRTVLDPADPATAGWIDHRIDLSPLAGRTVRFELTTRALALDTEHAALAVPLWGAPRILERRPRRGRYNLLLISLDTLRADYVGAYGSRLPTTPVLDRLAMGGALFEQAFATYPSTPGSHMSMLTGLYPGTHRVVGPFDVLATEIPTLAETLARAGYQTGAVTENGMLVASAGFSRGFASYRENKGASIWDATGQVDVTFREGRRWLEQHRGEAFFLFLHTYQVHEPYAPPPEHDVFTTYTEDGREIPITEATPVAIRDAHAYAGEVRYTDHELGRLLDGLAALGEADRTLVVVTSDHGEEFWEHGWKAHDETLYDEVLRVPLIVHAPGLVPPARVTTPVSLIDLLPTTLDLLGIEGERPVHGVSLTPLLGDSPATALANRPLFAELQKRRKQRRLVSARTATHKWIWHDSPDRGPEVFDLRADPDEKVNVASPALLAEGEPLRRRYEALAADAPVVPPSPPPTLDPHTVEKLRALGYTD